MLYRPKNQLTNVLFFISFLRQMKTSDLPVNMKKKIKRENLDCFSADDFLELGTYKAVSKQLERWTKRNIARRVIPGIYDIPSFNTTFEEYSAPSIPGVAEALARKYHWVISPSGNAILNQMGVSTQVVGQCLYLSSGPYRDYAIGSLQLTFRHVGSRSISNYSLCTIQAISALKALGKDHLDGAAKRKIGDFFTQEEQRIILAESKNAVVWIAEALQDIMGPGEERNPYVQSRRVEPRG